MKNISIVFILFFLFIAVSTQAQVLEATIDAISGKEAFINPNSLHPVELNDEVEIWEITDITKPENGSATYNENAIITFISDPGFIGTTTFEYTICATYFSTDCWNGKITMNVVENNSIFVAVPDSATGFQNGRYIVDFLANDMELYASNTGINVEDIDLYEWVFDILTYPDPSEGFTYLTDVYTNPDDEVPSYWQIEFEPFQPGDFEIQYFVCLENYLTNPAADCDTTTISIKAAPKCIDDDVSTPSNISVTFDPLDNDWINKNISYQVTACSDAQNGLVMHNPDQTFTYIPSPTYVGPDWFDYCYTNANNDEGTATIFIEVEAADSRVKGTVFFDSDQDCELSVPIGLEETDFPLANWILTFTDNDVNGGAEPQIAYTDAQGNYNIGLEPANYLVSVQVPQDGGWEYNCGSLGIVYVEGQNEVINGPNVPIHNDLNCENLSINLDLPRLRRCDTIPFLVTLCNVGTQTVEEPMAIVDVGPIIKPITPSLVENKIVVLETTRLVPGECRTLSFEGLVDCHATIGQTLCIRALANPRDPCVVPPTWSGASIQVDGVCQGEELDFRIANPTSNPMSSDREYRIYVDNVLMQAQSFRLDALEELTIPFPSSGATVRLEADQEADHPGDSRPRVSVELCDDPTGSLGIVNSVEQDDRDTGVDIKCDIIVDSFDPNDKRVSPEGVGEEHAIDPDTQLEYVIRFQNTGNDTAFRVMIIDSLSEFLEPTSIQLGNSSHDYTFEFLEPRVIAWFFDPIQLPDSNVNEPESNGYVSFKIKQIENNPIGTRIENNAAIYFDRNEPVITNTTFVTLQENYLKVGIEEETKAITEKINIKYGQVNQQIQVELPNNDYQVHLFNTLGQVVQKASSNNQPLVHFSLEGLPAATYFIQVINQDGKTIHGEKILKGQ